MPGPKTSAQRPKTRASPISKGGNPSERRAYWLEKRRGKIRRLLARAVRMGRPAKARKLSQALGAIS